MKRFLLFAGQIYYPSRGFDDFINSFDDAHDAQRTGIAFKAGDEYKWFQIVDGHTGDIIEDSEC